MADYLTIGGIQFRKSDLYQGKDKHAFVTTYNTEGPDTEYHVLLKDKTSVCITTQNPGHAESDKFNAKQASIMFNDKGKIDFNLKDGKQNNVSAWFSINNFGKQETDGNDVLDISFAN